jgi:putative membrane protein
MIDEQIAAEELILRDHLAIDRTKLANERTLLAYLRTALMLMVAGATAERVMGGSMAVIVTGWSMFVFGAAVAAFGTWRFVAMKQKVDRRNRAARQLQKSVDAGRS